MTMKRRGSVWWADIADATAPNGRRRQSLKTTDHETAKVLYRELQRKVLTREFGIAEAGDMTLEEAFEALMISRRRWVQAKSPETLRTNFKRIVSILGDRRKIASVDDKAVEQLVSALRQEGAAPSTLNAKLSIVRVIFEHALERKVITSAPKVPHFKQPAGRIRFYTPEEEVTLIGAFRSSSKPPHQVMADFATVLVDTGMRLSEGLRVEARDFNASAGTISIWENKASLPRTVPLTRRAFAVMQQRSQAGGRLFPELTKDRAEALWDHARAAAGLADDPQAVIHTLRHTCATRLAQQGMDAFTIMAWMGHKTIQTTLLYVHLNTASLRRGVGLLECAVGVPLQNESQPILRLAAGGAAA